MSILTRFTQKIFGSSGNNGIFGSAAASSPTLATTPTEVQSLSAFNTGWSAATLSAKTLPTLEEMQGLNYAITYQLAYMLQEGIAEYDSGTEYRTNSLVKKSGTTELYKSIANANTGNALTDVTKWTFCGDLSYLPTAVLGTAAYVNTGVSSGNVPLVGTQSATTSLAGAVELATDVEVTSGSDTQRAIVPSALASIYGASSQTNEIAPLKVSGAFTSKIVKRGSVSSTTGTTVTFAAAFPNACQNVILTCQNAAFRYAFLTSAPTTSQFTFVVNQSGGSSSTADVVYWQAEGY